MYNNAIGATRNVQCAIDFESQMRPIRFFSAKNLCHTGPWIFSVELNH
jgi:hypothetical protein